LERGVGEGTGGLLLSRKPTLYTHLFTTSTLKPAAILGQRRPFLLVRTKNEVRKEGKEKNYGRNKE
jgi:hypothetical protein